MPDLSNEQLQVIRLTAVRVGWQYSEICDVEDQVQAGYLKALEYLAAHPEAALDAPMCVVMSRRSVFDELRAASRGSRTLLATQKARERVRQQLVQELLRPPTSAELREAGAPEPVEMFVPVPLDDLGMFEAAPEADDPIEISEMLEALEKIPQRLRWVVQQIFLHERTAAEVARDLGVTANRVHQLKADALRLLRRRLA